MNVVEYMADFSTILVLDDEELITESLEMLLEDEFNVLTFNSPVDALKEVSANTDIRMVISDYKMPHMNGCEFLQEVKEYNPNIYRMILSGYADAKTLMRSVTDGTVQKFLTKPWEPEILLTIIKQICQRAG